MDVFDLSARITLDTSEYEQSLSDAEKQTSGFGKSIGGGLSKAAKIGATAIAGVTTAAAGVATFFVKGASDIAAYGDNIDKMSQKMGLSAEAYQEWDAVLQHSGTSIDAMVGGMQTLQKNAVNSADKFEKLGITQEQLAEMSPEELFAATVEGLQDMEEGSERTALANELLGRSARELGALLNTSSEDTKKMKERVHELGGVMSDEAVKASAKYQDTLQDMMTAFNGLQRNIKTEFLPSITLVMDGLTDLFSGGDGIGKINEGISQFIGKMTEAIPKVLEVGSNIIMSLIDAIIEHIPELISAGVKVVSTFIKGILKNKKKIFNAAKEIIYAFIDTIGKEFPALKSIMDKIRDVFETVFGFIEKNGPIIEGIIKGILAGFLAYKTAIVVITGVQKAIGLVTTAVKLLNGELALTSVVNPFGAITAAIGVTVGAIVALKAAEEAERQERLNMLSEISEEAQHAKEYADEFKRSLDDVYNANMNVKKSVEEEIKPHQDLIKELDGIVEDNGKIKQGYEERANYITQVLSEAFGVEIQLQDGVIIKYGEVMNELDKLIQKKQAAALLDASTNEYIETSKKVPELYSNMTTAQAELTEATELYNQKLKEAEEAAIERDKWGKEWLETESTEARAKANKYAKIYNDATAEAEALSQKINELNGVVSESSDQYYRATDFLQDYNNLQAAVASDAEDMTRQIQDMTNNIVEQGPHEMLVKQAEEANEYLQGLIKQREEGVAVSDQVIADATARLAAAVDAMKGGGQDAVSGYATGMEEDQPVIDAAKKMVDDAIEALETEQDSHSPSRLFKKDGVNAVLGYGKGISSKVKWLIGIITSMMQEVEEAFKTDIEKAKKWGIDLMKNFVEGIRAEIPELKAAVKEIGQVVADNLEHSHPKEGPMADDDTWMPDMMELFAEGISDNAGLVEDAAIDAFDFRNAIQSPEMSTVKEIENNGGGANLGRVVQLLQEIADNGMSVTLAGDADGIFTVVEQENRRRTKATRYNALSMMRS